MKKFHNLCASILKKASTIILLLIFVGTIAQAQELEWTFLKGYGKLPYYPVYGTKGVANSDNTPGARKDAVSWISGDKIYLFGGSGYSASGKNSYLNDLWEFDPSSNNWKWLKGDNTNDSYANYGTKGVATVSNSPGARTGAISWEKNGKLYLFGGIGIATQYSNGLLNDLWEFDITTQNWRWISGDNLTYQVGIYGTQGVSNNTNKPGTRSNSVSWISGDKLYLFGGYGNPQSGGNIGELSDLWQYDLTTNNWTWLSGLTTANQIGNYGVKNTPVSTNTPGSREDAISWVVNNKLYLFGGKGYATDVNSQGSLNDLWQYDISTGIWVWISGNNTANQLGDYGIKNTESSTNIPSARIGATSWRNGNNLYLLGGNRFDNYSSELNDLWIFNISSGNWTWLKGGSNINEVANYGDINVFNGNNTPGARQGAIGCFYDGKIYLFGGYVSSYTTTQFNDLWIYDIASSNWKWSKGSNIIAQIPTYGIQGVSDNISQPGAREEATTWVSNGVYYLFGGRSYNGGDMNDLWKYDSISGNWTLLKPSSIQDYGVKGVASSSNSPRNRYKACGWEKNGKLYLFGGRSNYFLNDLWEYDIATGNWTWLKGESSAAGTGIYGTLGVSNATNTPGGKQDASVSVSGNKVYLFGGYGSSSSGGSDYNDLWEYDISTGNWTWLTGSNAHSQYGKYGTKGVFNSNNIIGAREGAVSWVYNDRIFIFGGTGFNNTGDFGRLNDLWEFNLTTLEWRWLKGSNLRNEYGIYGTKGVGSSSNNPGGRDQSTSFIIGQKLYLLGGDGYTTFSATTMFNVPLDDLWEFNISSGNWTWLKGSNTVQTSSYYVTKNASSSLNNLGGRTRTSIGLIQNKVYLFGGYGRGIDGDETTRGDLWSITLPASTLPITLVDFKAKKENNKVKLEWLTSTELNNDRFEVERSNDGITFSKISTLQGTGSAHFYTTYDYQPLNGINYYRLKQIDLNGTINDLGIKSVNFKIDAEFIKVGVYPNPVSSEINLNFSNYIGGEIKATLIDLNGKTIHKEAFQLKNEGLSYAIKLNKKPKTGLYILNIEGQDLKTAIKLIVE